MAASKTLTPEQRKARAKLASSAAAERLALVKGLAEQVIGEPLGTKTTDELRDIYAKVAAGRPSATPEQIDKLRPILAGGAR